MLLNMLDVMEGQRDLVGRWAARGPPVWGTNKVSENRVVERAV